MVVVVVVVLLVVVVVVLVVVAGCAIVVRTLALVGFELAVRMGRAVLGVHPTARQGLPYQ